MKSIGDIALEWAPHSVEQKNNSYVIRFQDSQMELTPLQYQYFLDLQGRKSIKAMVNEKLNSGWLVNFTSLFALIEKAVAAHGILNRRIYSYILGERSGDETDLGSELKSLARSTAAFFSGESKVENDGCRPEEISQYPFFRVLAPDLQKEFFKRVKFYDVKKGQRLLARGSSGRDLFLVRKGSVGIFGGESGQNLIATLEEGSIFGELGFLFGSERKADVVTLEPSTIARIKFDPVFELHIREDKANALKERFWVIHALLKSDIFSNLPEELFDRLIFLGEPQSLTPGQVLFKEGDSGSDFYIIVQGEIAFYQNRELLRTLSQGQIFGEVALFVSKGVRTATVMAKEKSLVLKISQKDFYNFLAEDPRAAAQVQQVAEARFQNKDV